MFTLRAASAPLLALSFGPALVFGGHTITFNNNCDQTVQPMLTSMGGTPAKGDVLSKGGAWSYTVDENWTSGRVFGQTGGCAEPDGGGCTLLECDFSTSTWRQCNLSRVSGYNVAMSFAFSGANSTCGGVGATCASHDCSSSDAWVADIENGDSIKQCNESGIGITVDFCSSSSGGLTASDSSSTVSASPTSNPSVPDTATSPDATPSSSIGLGSAVPSSTVSCRAHGRRRRLRLRH